MNRTLFGLPVSMWAVGVVAGVVAFVWMRKRSTTSSSGGSTPGTPAGQPSFTAAQEIQDFQVFSALTGQQQGSDLNFLSEVAQLFQGGSTTGGSTVPASTPAQTAPANTGSTTPAVTSSPGTTNQTPTPVGG